MDHAVSHAPTSGPQPTLLKMASPQEQQATGVPCPECGRYFKTVKAERKHYTCDHNKEILLHVCQICDKPYASSHSLKRHSKVSHPNQDFMTPLNVKLPTPNQRPTNSVNIPVINEPVESPMAPTSTVTCTPYSLRSTTAPTDTLTPTLVNPAPKLRTSQSVISDAVTTTSPSHPSVTDTDNSDSGELRTENNTAASSDFNLSEYLLLPHRTFGSSPIPSTSTAPGPHFRPWTPTPSSSNNTGLHTPVLPVDLDIEDMAPNYMSTPNIPSRWDSPTEQLDQPASLPTSSATEPTPSEAPQNLVTYASTESSDGSPLHQVATPGPIDCSTQTSPMVVTYPPLPTYSQLNYAPVCERDNSYIQERIQALANIVEEILPGRGATIGEFVLFQYLLHRPPPNTTQD